MRMFKVFQSSNTYTIVIAKRWGIAYDGTANFYVDEGVVKDFSRNNWFFVEEI